MQNRVVFFWEGKKPPAYLTLCFSTFVSEFGTEGVVVLNQQNYKPFLGDLIDLGQLRMFSFAKQSDIISAYYLWRFGGCFLDVDTIVFSRSSRDFIQLNEGEDKLKYMGNNSTGGVHIGALSSNKGATAVTYWASILDQRVASWEQDNKWSYVGNDIIEPFLRSKEGQEFGQCYDVSDFCLTPETMLSSLVGLDESMPKPKLYKEFWFEAHPNSREILNKIESLNGGLISLHNSWTPNYYISLSKEEISKDKRLISLLLKEKADFSIFEDCERLLIDGTWN